MFENIVFYLGLLVFSVIAVLAIIVLAPVWIPVIVGSTIFFYALALVFGIVYLVITFIKYLFNL